MVLELPADYCLKERVAGLTFNTFKNLIFVRLLIKKLCQVNDKF